jgi:uncharacterized protein
VDFLSLWMGGNFTETQIKLHVPPLMRALMSHIFNSAHKHFWHPQLQKRRTQIMRSFQRLTPSKGMRELFASWVLDGKTCETNSIPAGSSGSLDKSTCRLAVVQNPGHFNLHQFRAYDLFENAGTPKNKKWLIIGPAEYDLPCRHWQLEALAFFDYLLYGSDNGYASQPPRYSKAGAESFGTAADIPIPGSSPVRLYPASAGEDSAMHVALLLLRADFLPQGSLGRELPLTASRHLTEKGAVKFLGLPFSK